MSAANGGNRDDPHREKAANIAAAGGCSATTISTAFEHMYTNRSLTICALQNVWYKPCFVCMVESGNGELELVREAHKVVDVDCFVTVCLDL